MTAIVFDMDDTLYEQAVPFEKAYQELFGDRYNLTCREVFVASRKHSDAVFELTRKNQMSMRDMYIYRISHAFRDFGIEITETEALEFQKYYSNEQKKISITEDMRNLFCWCKERNITLGLITNGSSEHQWNKIRDLGVLEWIPRANVFVSSDCGFSKPDIRLFEIARERIRVEMKDIWYVGDSFENDVTGAKRAGWKCIWLNRWNYAGSENGCYPDVIVKDERELIEVIHKIVGNVR